jgi:protoporphyrinogen oxidase
MRKVIIVGAGPAGLTAAAELQGAGCEVVVLEQDPVYVGGLSRTVQYKGFRFDVGGHRFFSKNPDIVDWWQRRLPNDFLTVRRQSRILYCNKLYDYPLRPANALRNLGLVTTGLCVLSYLWRRQFPVKPALTFEDWVTNRFGKRLFNIFFKTYTEKVWGIPCREISADWARQRIQELSLKKAIFNAFAGKQKDHVGIKTLISSFQYPRLGPGMMWEKTRDDLEKGGARIYMGKTVLEIHREGNLVTFVRTTTASGKNEDWAGDAFIVSMPLQDAVLSQRPALPPHVEAAARALRYRGFITVALIVRGENLFPDNWIYVHDARVRVGRVQNFNNWSAAMVPQKGMTCLGLEYFCNFRDSVWNLPDTEVIELAKREVSAIGLAKIDSIVDACVIRMEKAYPVYDSNYRSNVAIIQTALHAVSNLQSVGRNGMHKYNNQDHSMLTGILAARNLMGGSYDPWRVNGDAEYLEEREPAP